MRVYISGAITNTTDYLERFKVVEDILQAHGYETINPASLLDNLPPTTTHDEYMHISYALLDICDGIYMMDGWENSKGATYEYEYAIENGIQFVK